MIEQIQNGSKDEEQRFIRNALASVDKAERYQRLRLWTLRLLAMMGGIWLTFKRHGSDTVVDIEYSLVIVLGLAMAVCTSRVLYAMHKNTKSILQAIQDRS